MRLRPIPVLQVALCDPLGRLRSPTLMPFFGAAGPSPPPSCLHAQVLQHSYPILLHGRQTNLYAASYLQFGVREAQRLLQRQIIARTLMAETTRELEHPCFPRGTAFTEVLIGGDAGGEGAGEASEAPLKAVWQGQGDYGECAAKIAELFDKRAVCYNPPCTFDGRYQPRLGNRHFVAFSTFSWVVGALALPPNGTTLEDIETAARYVCKMEWAVLQERMRDLDEDTLRSLCFSATYVVVLLHFALGFDRQTLQIEFRRDSNISWALGAIVWEANNRFSRTQPLCVAAGTPRLAWQGGGGPSEAPG